jgi:hypothetical protein
MALALSIFMPGGIIVKAITFGIGLLAKAVGQGTKAFAKYKLGYRLVRWPKWLLTIN